MTRRPIVPGDRFFRLVVVQQVGEDSHCRRQQFQCKCDCGIVVVARRKSLLNGGTRSCGCRRKENARVAVRRACVTHDRTHSKEYRAWAHMTDRCTKTNRRDSTRYVGRGIRVCSAWLGAGGFDAFFKHIGAAPSAHHSIDRIDNNRGYEPGNVQWATATQQARNRRSNRLITAFGRVQPLATWAQESGLKAATILRRITVLGWPAEQAITTSPLGKQA